MKPERQLYIMNLISFTSMMLVVGFIIIALVLIPYIRVPMLTFFTFLMLMSAFTLVPRFWEKKTHELRKAISEKDGDE